MQSDDRYAPDGDSTRSAVKDAGHLTPGVAVHPAAGSGRQDGRSTGDDANEKVRTAEVDEEKSSRPRHRAASRRQHDQVDDVGQDNTAADDRRDRRLKCRDESVVSAGIRRQRDSVVTAV